MAEVARTHALRCDAKQAEARFKHFDSWIATVPHFRLGDALPDPIVKGTQPIYVEGGDGVPIISTLAIQGLAIDIDACRLAIDIDYGPKDVRKPRIGDVLLTVDGGTSIGKPVYFDLDDDWGVDSHVAILRPAELDPMLLVFLLASPMGQLQFQRAESGASGQTAVTEDDIRRFRFPEIDAATSKAAVRGIERARRQAEELRQRAIELEDDGWETFVRTYAPSLS